MVKEMAGFANSYYGVGFFEIFLVVWQIPFPQSMSNCYSMPS